MEFLIFIFIAAIIVIPIACLMNSNSSKNATTSTVQIKNTEAIKNWRQQRKEKYDAWLQSMKSKHGNLEVAIPIVTSEPDNTLLIFAESEELIYSTACVKFKDIISCKVEDNAKVINGKVTAITKSDVWNEIQRSSLQKNFWEDNWHLACWSRKTCN